MEERVHTRPLRLCAARVEPFPFHTPGEEGRIQVPLGHDSTVADVPALRERLARKRRRSTSKSTSHSGHVYPLTGLAHCARCRGPMRGSSSQTYRYYRDPARDRGETCDQRMIKAEEAEDALGDVLQSLALPEAWTNAWNG